MKVHCDDAAWWESKCKAAEGEGRGAPVTVEAKTASARREATRPVTDAACSFEYYRNVMFALSNFSCDLPT
jgi:hypothetical protein